MTKNKTRGIKNKPKKKRRTIYFVLHEYVDWYQKSEGEWKESIESMKQFIMRNVVRKKRDEEKRRDAKKLTKN